MAIVLGFLVLGTVTNDAASTAIRETIGTQVLSFVTGAAEGIAQKIDLVEEMLNELAVRAAKSRLDNPEAVEALIRADGAIFSLANLITFLRPDGSVIADWPVDAVRRKTNYADREWMRQVIKTGKTVISEPFLGRSSTTPRIVLATPVFDAGGQIAAVATATILILEPNFIGHVTRQKIGQEGYLLLAARNGTVIGHPDSSQIMAPIASTGTAEAFNRAGSGWSGYMESAGVDQKLRLLTASPVGDTGWVLIGVMSGNEAYVPVARLHNQLLTLSAVVILLVLAATWFILARLLMPLSALREAVENLTTRHTSSPRLVIDERMRGVAEIDAVSVAIANLLEDLARTQAEQMKLAAIVSSSEDAIVSEDLYRTITSWNRTSERMFGYPADEAIGRKSTFLVSEDEQPDDSRRRALTIQGGAYSRYTGTCMCKDGTPVSVSITQSNIVDTEGRKIGISLVYRDISQRIEARRALEASLREKETLLREIHHRVKNNLQIISSLLRFQSKKANTPEAAAAFADGQDRLRSMILMHEKLYRSHNIARIDLGDYLRTLAEQMRDSYRATSGNVGLEINAGEVILPVEVALPCGMLLAELLSNAYKYAFPDERGGTLRIDLRPREQGFLLVVQDDGVGLPDSVDINSPQTFGLQLVAMLAMQINAGLRFERGPGLKVEVSVESEHQADAAQPKAA